MGAAIQEFLKQLEADLIDFNQDLVRIRSITGNEGDAARFVRDKMIELDYDQVYIDELGNVIGVMGDGPVTVLFDSHIDTVQADENSGWTVDPFGGEIHDGFLYGRGSVDMKGAVAATVYAGHALKKAGNLSNKKVIISVSVMEEDFDGEALYHMCTKGGIKPNYAIICEPSNMKLALGHNGRAMLVVKTKGVPAHGSAPQNGENAVYKMTGIIEAVGSMQDNFETGKVRSGSIALSRIESVSDSLNAIPGECTVYLDRRTVFGEDEQTISTEMEQLITGRDASWAIYEDQADSWTGLEIRTRCYYPAWQIEESHSFVKTCEHTYRNLFSKAPDKILWDFCTNGVTTAGKLGIPTIGIGPGNPKLAHMVDECCSTDEISKACLFYALLVEQL